MTKDNDFLKSLIVDKETIQRTNALSRFAGKRAYYISHYKNAYLKHLKDEYNKLHKMFPNVEIVPEARIKGQKSYADKVKRVVNEDPNKDIQLYINSPGGSVSAGFAIYDTMNYIKPDVSTICIGMAASMGAFLLASGAKGKRFALPNSDIMIHQPSGGAQGQASDIQINAEKILKIRKKLNEILAERTGQDLEKIERDTDRDYWLTSEEAKKYGLIDKVIEKRV